MHDVYAVIVEPRDRAVLHPHRTPGQETDAVDADTRAHRPVDGDAANDYVVVRPGVDDDAIDGGGKKTAERAITVDGDRLGDRHGAEAARIEHRNLATGGGLRDRSGKGLARRGAAARIGIITH